MGNIQARFLISIRLGHNCTIVCYHQNRLQLTDVSIYIQGASYRVWINIIVIIDFYIIDTRRVAYGQLRRSCNSTVFICQLT